MNSDYEKNEKETKEYLERIISVYFKEFLNKFDSIYRIINLN